MYSIEFYRTENNKIPAKEFIESQDAKTYAGILRELKHLESTGPLSREPHTKFLKDGIFEIRIRQEKSVRILYFFFANQRIVLTNGFVKKTNKTPNKEIEKAIQYKNDFYERNGA